MYFEHEQQELAEAFSEDIKNKIKHYETEADIRLNWFSEQGYCEVLNRLTPELTEALGFRTISPYGFLPFEIDGIPYALTWSPSNATAWAAKNLRSGRVEKMSDQWEVEEFKHTVAKLHCSELLASLVDIVMPESYLGNKKPLGV